VVFDPAFEVEVMTMRCTYGCQSACTVYIDILESSTPPLYPHLYTTPYTQLIMSSALSINHTIKLNSGNLIPSLGFGVYLVKGSQGETAIKQAVKSGYRHCM
jgi:hypothetical protein